MHRLEKSQITSVLEHWMDSLDSPEGDPSTHVLIASLQEHCLPADGGSYMAFWRRFRELFEDDYDTRKRIKTVLEQKGFNADNSVCFGHLSL